MKGRILIDKKRSEVARTSRTQKKFSKKKKPLLLKIFLTIVTLGFAGMISGAVVFFLYIKDAPALNEKKLTTIASSKIYDKNGELIADLGKEKREILDANEIPKTLSNAITSIEDQHFYEHHGIDLLRILSSAFHNATTSSTQGGSTLTQQLIKLSYFSTQKTDQNLKRKAQEAWLALQLEKKYSKQEILTYYANKIFMGNQIYGIKTAASAYYKKPLKELTLAQTVLLAGIPQAPTLYDPYTHPEEAKKRRNLVLSAMLKNKKITNEEYKTARDTPIEEGLQPLQESNSDLKTVDPYLVEVIKEVKNKTGKNVWTDGLSVYTNIDMQAQQRLYEIVNTDNYIDFPDNEMQIASTLVEVKTGKVLAQIGGRNIPETTSFGTNRATQNDRDWGSTMKPMVDYAPAIEYLHYSTAQRFNDVKSFYPGTDKQIYDWDLKYMGNMSMRTALVESRNVPAIKALEDVGLEKANDFLGNIGIHYPKLFYSNAISSSSPNSEEKYGVSSLRIAAAYAAFANDGIFQTPYYVNKVIYNDDSEETFKPKATRAMQAATAYMITDMLKGIFNQGFGKSAGTPGLYEAAKTGTSNYSDEELEKNPDLKAIAARHQVIAPDENFVGYSPLYSISVWSGYSNRLTPMVYENFRIPGDVYRELMSFMINSQKNQDWKKPADVYRSGSELYLENSPGYFGRKSSSSYNNYYSTSRTSSSSYAAIEEMTPSSSSSEVAPPATSTSASSSSSSGP